jgi:magnesium chelatase accessory protein
MSRPDWQREGRHWPHSEASRFVEAGGLRWHVQVMGDGPVVLLLHGTGAATHSWRGMMPLLARNFTVVAPDLPGHGFTAAPRTEGYSLPKMATAVESLMAALAVGPVLSIGHSAGAAVAVRMALDGALDAPIVSINGALLPFPGVARQIFPAMARALFLNPFVPRLFALQGKSRTFVGNFLERSTGSKIDVEGARLYQSLFARSDHCAAALGMMAHWDLDALKCDLPKLSAPLLLIAAEDDAAVPPTVAGQVAKIVPHAEAMKLPALGHLAHEEAPDRIADAVSAFAGRHGIGATTRGKGK